MASRMKKLRAEEQERLASGGTRAGGLETQADRAREQFDAASAARESATATFESFREQLGEDVESLRGNQVGRGRLDTGFGFEDEDRLVRGGLRDLNREISRGAFQAESLNLRNIEGQTGAAEGARERDLSFLTGSMDREQARENEKRQRRRSRFGALLGGVGAAVGSFGGVPGASLGAKIGSAVGSNL